VAPARGQAALRGAVALPPLAAAVLSAPSPAMLRAAGATGVAAGACLAAAAEEAGDGAREAAREARERRRRPPS
jgi:hypothetical protein